MKFLYPTEVKRRNVPRSLRFGAHIAPEPVSTSDATYSRPRSAVGTLPLAVTESFVPKVLGMAASGAPKNAPEDAPAYCAGLSGVCGVRVRCVWGVRVRCVC